MPDLVYSLDKMSSYILRDISSVTPKRNHLFNLIFGNEIIKMSHQKNL